MGFLDFWRNQPHSESQLTLFGEAEGIVRSDEPSRLAANKALQDEVRDRGGTRQTHAAVNRIVCQNVLGHEPKELYSSLELPLNDRVHLPTEAKEALMVGDIAARNQIQADEASGHQEILYSADKGSKKAKSIFPLW
jgi:hypothetical protein